MKRHKKKTQKREADHVPEEILIRILTNLPVQSIVRFRLVCRQWKLHTESAFFDNLYQRNHNNSNWSILHGNYRYPESCLEELKFYLPRPHGSSYSLSFSCLFNRNKNKIKEIRVVGCADGLVLVRVKTDNEEVSYYIGNPVLAQWIQLPPPPPPPGYNDSGLVTKTQNGALLGYKVVRMHGKALLSVFSKILSFQIFSSDTGEWSVEHVSCPGQGIDMRFISNPVPLNGKLHWLDNSRRIIVHDFFYVGQVRAISLPAKIHGNRYLWFEGRFQYKTCSSPCDKMICTTSQGYIVLIDVRLIDNVDYNVRVWRLKSDSWSWDKAWEINLSTLGLHFECVIMAINYFDINIIYLWDFKKNCYLAYNLQTRTKSRGTRNKDRTSFLSSIIPKVHGTCIDDPVYKQDYYSFESRSCVLQFVPSFQQVPTKGLSLI